MRNQQIIINILLIAALLIAGTLFLQAQETGTQEKQDKVETQQEFVEVLNVEVVLRALKKGNPTGGLKLEDLTLYEDGEERDITSFVEVERKMNKDFNLRIEGDKSDTKFVGPRRFFFIYISLTEPDPDFDKALDLFFNEIFGHGDYALTIVGNHIFKVTKPEQARELLPEIKRKVEEIALISKRKKDMIIKRLEKEFRDFEYQMTTVERKSNTRKIMYENMIKAMVERLGNSYRSAWNEYKFQRARLDAEKIKQLARSLKPLNFEKWGLIFYQPETFPQFNPESIVAQRRQTFSNISEIQRLFSNMTRDMQSPSNSIQMEEIRSAFIESNVTFHLFTPRPTSQSQIPSHFLKISNIYSDWQNVFTNIAKATGGQVKDTGVLDKSLIETLNKKDIFYRLTYHPKQSLNRNRKLEIKCRKSSLKLMYSKDITIHKANEIQIDSFLFNFPTLAFRIKNYQQLFDGSILYGDIRVKVSAVSDKGDMFNFNRNFEPSEGIVSASMKLNFRHGGDYSLIVEALDNQTGQKAVFSQKIKVPKTGLDLPVLITQKHKEGHVKDRESKLDRILEKTAKYCQLLERARFYFICKEEVKDFYATEGKVIKNDEYAHDYQIIMEESGEMNEKRWPYEPDEKKKKKRKRNKTEDDYFIITNFYSQYPFLMPVTLLSKENQGKYKYRLLATEKIGNRTTYKISVDPGKKGATSINHGIVWLDIDDGSVVKIELNPRSVRGIKKLQTIARKKGARIQLTDTHWYEVRRDSLRFPSRTEIDHRNYEALVAKNQQPKEIERLKTSFAYKSYRFFSVNTDVVDSGHK